MKIVGWITYWPLDHYVMETDSEKIFGVGLIPIFTDAEYKLASFPVHIL